MLGGAMPVVSFYPQEDFEPAENGVAAPVPDSYGRNRPVAGRNGYT